MNKILIAALAVIVALYGWRMVQSQTPGESGLYNCTVSVETFSCTKMAPTATPTSGVPVASVTSTSSPTRTATPTATPTRTQTPTPTVAVPPTTTPTPSAGSTTEKIVASINANHPACVQGTVGYDWQFHGRYGSRTPPNGAHILAMWAGTNWMATCPDGPELSPSANAQFEWRNFKSQALVGPGPVYHWVTITTRVWGWQVNNPNAGGIFASCGNYACNSPYNVPHGKGQQFYAARSDSPLPANFVGWLGTYEARMIGPDAGSAKFMATCGADWLGSNSGPYYGDAVFGAYQQIGTAFTLVSCTTLDAATIRQYPPPVP